MANVFTHGFIKPSCAMGSAKGPQASAFIGHRLANLLDSRLTMLRFPNGRKFY